MHPYLKGKRLIEILAAILIVFFAAPYLSGFLDSLKPSDKWSISKDGLVSYSQNRGNVEYTEIILNDTPEFVRSKIIYESKGEKIYALLRVPKTGAKAIPNSKMPAIILLPGALITKESMEGRAETFAKRGYATLILDERGNRGETGGGIRSMDDEYAAFSRNEEPEQHRMVYDVLRAFDFLRQRNYVDPENIAVFGESMGGRFAIMAAAVEPRIKAVIGVSTAGYGTLDRQPPNAGAARFFAAIDPDAYIGKISPRYVLVVHSENDTVIPIDSAKMTFSRAGEPKKFATVSCNTHGWCDEMEPVLGEELGRIFSGR